MNGEQKLSLTEVLDLAVRLHREGRLAEAEEIYSQVLRGVPDQADALHFLGMLRHQTGNTQEAIRLLSQAVSLVPDYADALNNLGNMFRLEDRLEEAARALRQVIALRPEHAEAHNNLGVVLKEQGDLEGAVASYRCAIALRPEDADAYHNLGNALSAQGRHEEASQAWKTTVTLQPGHTSAWHQLGIFYRDNGQTEEALAAFQQTIRCNAQHTAAHLELGHLLRKQRAAEPAMHAYRRALALDPDCENARHYLAVILEALGRPEEALEVWRDWLVHSPNHPVPRHMLAAASGAQAPERAGDDFVRVVFNGFAERFERHLEGLEYRAPQYVAAAVAAEYPSPQPTLSVLDAGCGTGWCGPMLRPFAAQLAGVDLSPGMLEKARVGRGYDTLVEAELTDFMNRHPMAYDLIVSADTLCYFGNLTPVFHAAHQALRPGGCLIFTLESWEESGAAAAGYKLHSRGRYCHRKDYVETRLVQAGLRVRAIAQATLRLEGGLSVVGWVVTARKGISDF